MTKILLFCFIIINIISVLRRKNNIFIDIYSFFTFWALFTFNFNNADFFNYQNRYLNNLGGDGFILDLVMRYLNKIEWSYNQFLGLLSFLGLFLIFFTIWKLSINRSLVYLCYLVYPFFLDVVQIKNFILQAIIVYLISNFIQTSQIKKNIILLTFGLGFHTAAIFYYPLILFCKRMSLRVMYLFANISFMILFFINIRVLKIEKMLFFIPEWKVIGYISNFSKIGWVIFVIVQIFIFILFFKNIKKTDIKLNYDCFLLKKVYVFLMIYLGLYLINTTFERVFRNLLLIMYIHLSNVYMQKKQKKVLFDLGFIVIILCMTFLFKFREGVFIPVIECNYLNI